MRQFQLREILGHKVVDCDGVTVGHLEEVEAERGAEVCAIAAYIVEHHGLLDRMSSWTLTASMQKALQRNRDKRPFRIPWDEMDMSDPSHPRTLLPKSQLSRVGEDIGPG